MIINVMIILSMKTTLIRNLAASLSRSILLLPDAGLREVAIVNEIIEQHSKDFFRNTFLQDLIFLIKIYLESWKKDNHSI